MISEISIYKIDWQWYARIIDGQAEAELSLASFYAMGDDPTRQDMLDAMQEVGLAYEAQIDESEIVVDEDGRTATWERKEKAMGIEGLPEGWELLAIRNVRKGEWFINTAGRPEEWAAKLESVYVYPVIRKIEKPKQYRAFANRAEFVAHPLSSDWIDIGDGLLAKAAQCDELGVWFNNFSLALRKNYDDAFISLKFRDGTPFGVEVVE